MSYYFRHQELHLTVNNKQVNIISYYFIIIRCYNHIQYHIVKCLCVHLYCFSSIVSSVIQCVCVCKPINYYEHFDRRILLSTLTLIEFFCIKFSRTNISTRYDTLTKFVDHDTTPIRYNQQFLAQGNNRSHIKVIILYFRIKGSLYHL